MTGLLSGVSLIAWAGVWSLASGHELQPASVRPVVLVQHAMGADSPYSRGTSTRVMDANGSGAREPRTESEEARARLGELPITSGSSRGWSEPSGTAASRATLPLPAARRYAIGGVTPAAPASVPQLFVAPVSHDVDDEPTR